MINRRRTVSRRALPARIAAALWLLLGWAAIGCEPEPPLASLRVGITWDAKTEDRFVASGARRFECSYSRGRWRPFAISGDLESELNQGVLSDRLRDTLNQNLAKLADAGFQLSKNTTVEVAGKGPIWLVLDRDSNRLLYIHKRTGHASDEGVLPVYLAPPFASVKYWTLSNGLSVTIDCTRLRESDPEQITSLAFANSTMLFACKGESWYYAEGVEWTDGGCRLIGLDLRGSNIVEDRGQAGPPVYLWKGMADGEAEAAIKAARLAALPTSDDWLKRFPKSGSWSRYSLPGERELAVNLDAGPAPASRKVRWLIVEAAAPGDPGSKPARYRIECELLDLTRPFGDGWHRAFRDAWSWDPNDPERMRRLIGAGQRRWTDDQLPAGERQR